MVVPLGHTVVLTGVAPEVGHIVVLFGHTVVLRGVSPEGGRMVVLFDHTVVPLPFFFFLRNCNATSFPIPLSSPLFFYGVGN